MCRELIGTWFLLKTGTYIMMQWSKHTSVLMFYTHFLSCFFCRDITHLELLSCSWSVCKKQGSQCTCNIVVCLCSHCCYGNATVCSLCIVIRILLSAMKYWNLCHFTLEAQTSIFCVVALHVSLPAIWSTLRSTCKVHDIFGEILIKFEVSRRIFLEVSKSRVVKNWSSGSWADTRRQTDRLADGHGRANGLYGDFVKVPKKVYGCCGSQSCC